MKGKRPRREEELEEKEKKKKKKEKKKEKTKNGLKKRGAMCESKMVDHSCH